jgi:5-formyltetrahydrofolate cyclo-ligase
VAELSVNVAQWRKEQRSRLIEARMAVALETHQSRGAAIMRAIAEILPPSANAAVGCYWPFRREPDCLPFMRDAVRAGGRIALPVVIARGRPLEFRLWTETTTMKPGPWNIPQPADTECVIPAVLVIPLVGFDDQGYRLGYGAGFYDITLSSLSPQPFKVGVGFELAHLPTIHPQAFDVPMDVIFTEDGRREFRRI